jgi:hypothetical protein
MFYRSINEMSIGDTTTWSMIYKHHSYDFIGFIYILLIQATTYREKRKRAIKQYQWPVL